MRVVGAQHVLHCSSSRCVYGKLETFVRISSLDTDLIQVNSIRALSPVIP